MLKEKVIFSVDLVGQHSELPFKGEFVMKTKLSWREVAREDEIRRTFLGANAAEASADAALGAQAYAFMLARAVDAPKWWTDPAFDCGAKTDDLNVLVAVWQKAVEAVDAEFARVKDAAAKAKADLEAQAKKD